MGITKSAHASEEMMQAAVNAIGRSKESMSGFPGSKKRSEDNHLRLMPVSP
jgi:hypothetical protein